MAAAETVYIACTLQVNGSDYCFGFLLCGTAGEAAAELYDQIDMEYREGSGQRNRIIVHNYLTGGGMLWVGSRSSSQWIRKTDYGTRLQVIATCSPEHYNAAAQRSVNRLPGELGCKIKYKKGTELHMLL